MTGIRPAGRIVASLFTLVLVAGVALPAAAQLCMLPDVLPTEEAPPCHDDGAGEPAVPLPERSMECCHVSAEMAFDEAVIVKVEAVPALQPADRVALATELEVPAEVRVSKVHAHGPGGIAPVADLHILYAVMLN